jgi:mannose-6-phosphate isomerase-like protein (cupin superfamily)
MSNTTIPVSTRDALLIEKFPWGTLQWVANAALFAGAQQSLGFCEIGVGQRSPLHVHPNCDEVLTVLSGTGRHSYEDGAFELKAGGTIHIPSGVRHNLVNTGSEPLTCLLAFSSGQRETVFLE